MTRDDDGKAGEAGKRDGMGRADDHANEHWRRCFDECAVDVARTKPVFDSEDVRRLMRERHPNATTHELRAVGPRMKALIGRGIAVPRYEFNMSTLPQCHRRRMMAWQSLIYRGPVVIKRRWIKPIDPRDL